MYTHKLTRLFQRGNEPARGTPEVITADAESNLDIAVPHSSTDKVVNESFLVADLKSVWIESDRDVTLKTNSVSEADDTIPLGAGKTLIWTPNCGFACPFTVDVTSLHFVNASDAAGDDATVEIHILRDSTP